MVAPPSSRTASKGKGLSDDKPEWWTSDEWETPSEVVARLGPFDLDPCCREETAKAPMFFTKDSNGLAQRWHGRVWVNPPYSDPRPWIARAVDAVTNAECHEVVMLLPAAIDTTWFHDLVLPNADVVFMRGRIKFIGWKGTPIGSPKAGTILAIFPKRERVFVLNERSAKPVAVDAVARTDREGHRLTLRERRSLRSSARDVDDPVDAESAKTRVGRAGEEIGPVHTNSE